MNIQGRDIPYMLYAQNAPRPDWSGRRDFHWEELPTVYVS